MKGFGQKRITLECIECGRKVTRSNNKPARCFICKRKQKVNRTRLRRLKIKQG